MSVSENSVSISMILKVSSLASQLQAIALGKGHD
jgi:hypothetical protein